MRGGRGGARGGIRGGRGGYSNGAGAGVGSSTNAWGNGNGITADATTTATTSDGWATQVQQATEGEDDGGWGSTAEPAPVATTTSQNTEDFAAAGGLSDAPAEVELDKAAKAGGTGWQEEVKKDIPGKTAAPVVPAKKTWAQIAK